MEFQQHFFQQSLKTVSVCCDRCRVCPLPSSAYRSTPLSNPPKVTRYLLICLFHISWGGGCFGCVGKCCKIYFIPQIFLGKQSFMIRLAYFSVLTCNNIISLEQKKTCFIVSHNLQKFSVTKTVAGNSLGSLADMGSCLN